MQTNKQIHTKKKCKQASKQIKTKIIIPKQNKEKRTNKRKCASKYKQTNSDRHKHSKQKGKIKTNNNNNNKTTKPSAAKILYSSNSSNNSNRKQNSNTQQKKQQ